MLSELYGQDREEALEVLDNDAEFDRWLEAFQERKRREARSGPAAPNTTSLEEMRKRLRAQGEGEW